MKPNKNVPWPWDSYKLSSSYHITYVNSQMLNNPFENGPMVGFALFLPKKLLSVLSHLGQYFLSFQILMFEN